MARRDALALLADDSLLGEVADLVSGRQTDTTPETDERERETKRRPHEVRRGKRQMNVTLPDAAWRGEVAALAKRWGVRPSDVVLYALAHLMGDVEAGRVRMPKLKGEHWQYHHKTGEPFAKLPWEPPETPV